VQPSHKYSDIHVQINLPLIQRHTTVGSFAAVNYPITVSEFGSLIGRGGAKNYGHENAGREIDGPICLLTYLLTLCAYNSYLFLISTTFTLSSVVRIHRKLGQAMFKRDMHHFLDRRTDGRTDDTHNVAY